MISRVFSRAGLFRPWRLAAAALLLGGSVSSAATNALGPAIAAYVEEKRAQAGIPGMAVGVLLDGQPILKRGFGFSDPKLKTEVAADTLFELASNSKAFTGLAVELLRLEGKLDPTDSLQRYLPELEVYHGEKRVDVTAEQCLHHTSGLPWETIDRIPVGDGSDALANTVLRLRGTNLMAPPGEVFSYATANYSVLGLLLERVSGASFEPLVERKILQPLGLRRTFPGRPAAERARGLARGHRAGFLGMVPYDGPSFRGALPSGYFISCLDDMMRWAALQADPADAPPLLQRAMRNSHEVSGNKAGETVRYVSGWNLDESSGTIFHDGQNPGFSSFVLVRPGDGLAIVILANASSSRMAELGRGILDLVEGRPARKVNTDFNRKLDRLLVAGLAVLSALTILGCARLVFVFLRHREARGRPGFAQISAALSILGLALAGWWIVPELTGLSWFTMGVWGPASFWPAVVAVSVFAVVAALNVATFGGAKRRMEKA